MLMHNMHIADGSRLPTTSVFPLRTLAGFPRHGALRLFCCINFRLVPEAPRGSLILVLVQPSRDSHRTERVPIVQ